MKHLFRNVLNSIAMFIFVVVLMACVDSNPLITESPQIEDSPIYLSVKIVELVGPRSLQTPYYNYPMAITIAGEYVGNDTTDLNGWLVLEEGFVLAEEDTVKLHFIGLDHTVFLTVKSVFPANNYWFVETLEEARTNTPEWGYHVWIRSTYGDFFKRE